MFRKILIPIDLAHAEKLDKAVTTAVRLARLDGSPVVFAAVTSNAPGSLAHTPEEFRARLDAYAAEQAAEHAVSASGHAVFVHDPATELEDGLMTAVHETGADLVVMATHVPHIGDRLWPSNGGRLAGHADVSVFLVR